MLYEKHIDSPVGTLRIVASDKGLRYVGFEGADGKYAALDGEAEPSETHIMLVRAEKQLAEYFAGKRSAFDLPLELKGTVFQINAWRALQKIPHGETRSYGEQAASMGDVKKARAVGMANNRNPISIIIPCHRVIGSTGALVGYGGGLKRKEWLLALEAAVTQRKSA
ncbi:MAG: methylated-DNA--[protein]-cysteine S-methyltransferase [Alphaproteobacteria bacterium]|nr:methylated-DNA--[protein]-cysteine S-methyltransferase [Alphaproteobacteria bacterium]